MSAPAAVFSALRWEGDRLALLDQTRLPHTELWLGCVRAADTAAEIRRLAVRGAPNIGIAAAYGVALEVAAAPNWWEPGVAALRAARPTAVNLAWAGDRARDRARRRAAREPGVGRRVALSRTELISPDAYTRSCRQTTRDSDASVRRRTAPAARSARGWRVPAGCTCSGSRSRYQAIVCSRHSSCGLGDQPSTRLAFVER